MTPEANLSKADLHIHTRFSYDSMARIKYIVNRALEKGIKIIAITDHDTIRGAKRVKKYVEKKGIPLEVIVGEEITSLRGHVIGLFLKKHVPPFLPLRETIKRIKDQGGLVIIPHPGFSESKPKPRLFRVRTHYSEILDDPTVLEQIDAIEAANFTMFDNDLRQNVANYAHKFNKPLVGSSDAHITRHIGTIYTLFPGSTIDDFKQALISQTTKPVIERIWTVTDWIWHHACAFKMPFAFACYNLKNLITRAITFVLKKIWPTKKVSTIHRDHAGVKPSVENKSKVKDPLSV